MKKIFLMISAVFLAVFMVVGCNQGSGQSDNPTPSSEPEAIKLNDTQQAVYDEIIMGWVMTVASETFSADRVAEGLNAMNEQLKSSNAGFRIYDKKAGTDIAEGTTKEELQARLIPIAP